jgi:hypothetical protein
MKNHSNYLREIKVQTLKLNTTLALCSLKKTQSIIFQEKQM